MRVVALISGGKDSCYNMMQCVAEGHEIVALANLHPKDKDELDSYMYQTVGHQGIEKLAEAMCLPLYRRETKGQSIQRGKQYIPKLDGIGDGDEVEDLYELLKVTKDDMNIDAVAVGAILSDYQRIRVENVCSRLNLVPLAYLWRRDQTELLQEMIDCQIYAIIIKVAALGLIPDRHLGKSLRDMQPHLIKMRDKYGLNVCGEGGEYETFTLDCPLFKQRINVDDMQIIISSSDTICPVGYINFTKMHLTLKDITNVIKNNNEIVNVKRSIDYISDLNESSYSDLSDPDLSETELELIEKENRMRESLSRDDIIKAESISRSNSISQNFKDMSNVVTNCTINDSDQQQNTDTTDKKFDDNQIKSETSPLSQATLIKTESYEDQATNMCTNASGGTPLSPIKYECELDEIKNEPNAVNNSKGWLWIAGIQGTGNDPCEGITIALNKLEEIILEHQYNLTDICYITLYVRNINEYSLMNDYYSKMIHFYNPPTRVCVECPLPHNLHVILEAVAYHPETEVDEIEHKRHTMHVQGISHWAPANIGPYSQSTRIGEITYISGQIALVPGSMTIIEGGIRQQCKLALRHISRIAKAMNAQGQLRDVVQGICYVTHPSYVTEARRQWERRTANAIMDYIVVPALPRQALVEWQVWTHTHNDRFEYEETGCSIANFTTMIRRRWNYENNCAAIVCYVTTGSATSTAQLTQLSNEVITNHKQLAQSLTGDQLMDILTYTLNKLLKGYPTVPKVLSDDNLQEAVQQYHKTQQQQQPYKPPAIHLRLFYQVTASPSVDLITETIQLFKKEKSQTCANLAVTVIPASNLHNFSTFMSICGIRHE